MTMGREDTIAAIATPEGSGGISIIRVSGPEAGIIGEKVFSKELRDHILTYGGILAGNGEILDQGMAVFMAAPRTYTRENVLELHCHGGMYLARKILARCVEAGARPAEPGEFTKRAYLNGRIDLTQAQAVMDMIAANSEASAKAALERLNGGLCRKIAEYGQRLIELAAKLEAFIDYPDDDLDDVTASEAINELIPIIETFQAEVNQAEFGRRRREGVRVAIVGAPNAGKSTLFNALLREERAIVSDIPGTTRDTLVEPVSIDGQLFLITDTAGLRETDDRIEQQGVLRAHKAVDEADILILCVDGTEPLSEELKPFLDDLRAVLAYNKSDLIEEHNEDNREGEGAIFLSAIRGDNIQQLKNKLLEKAGTKSAHTALLTHEQDVFAVNEALACLREAEEALRQGMLDCGTLEIRNALRKLSSITETDDEDVLDVMFARFCLGK